MSGGVVAFELSGGPGCGLEVWLPMKPPGATYLLDFPLAADPAGAKATWAYQFANRSTAAGWVLEAVMKVGTWGGAPNL